MIRYLFFIAFHILELCQITLKYEGNSQICYSKCDKFPRKLELSLDSLRSARQFLPLPSHTLSQLIGPWASSNFFGRLNFMGLGGLKIFFLFFGLTHLPVMIWKGEFCYLVVYRAMTHMIAIVIDTEHSHLSICGFFFFQLALMSHFLVTTNFYVVLYIRIWSSPFVYITWPGWPYYKAE